MCLLVTDRCCQYCGIEGNDFRDLNDLREYFLKVPHPLVSTTNQQSREFLKPINAIRIGCSTRDLLQLIV